MPKLAANLTLLFGEVDFPDRFAKARAAGFRAVECQFPYAFGAPVIKAALENGGLEMVLHNLPAGDWMVDEQAVACHPERTEAFRQGVERAIGYAQAIGCPRLNCLAGVRPSAVSVSAARETFVENLAFAASRAFDAGLELVTEPINTFDVPGFFLSRFDEALAIVRDIGAPNLSIQFDIYHMHRMGEDVTGLLDRHLDVIGHIQVADAPGRHEPGTGEIDVAGVFAQLDRLGYRGWVGCEYNPATTTDDGLDWAREYLV